MSRLTISRDDLHKLYVESEVSRNEKLIKREIEGIRVEILRANIAGKTSYETKFYHETYRGCFLSELQKIFIDSKIKYVTATNEQLDDPLCYFVIDWSLDREGRVNSERVCSERVNNERVCEERVNNERDNVVMVNPEIDN